MSMKNPAYRKYLAGLLILAIAGSTACKKQEKKKEADYAINSMPKKAEADEIPAGYSAFAVDKWDLALCYPSDAEIDFSKKSGVSIVIDEDQEIRVQKEDDEARPPEELFEEITENLSDEFDKLKDSKVKETKVAKRTLYYQEYSAKETGVNVYVEIYDEFTLIYTAIAEDPSDLEPVMNTIIASVVFDAEAYEDIEPAPVVTEPGKTSMIRLEDGGHNLAITVPEENLQQVECPVGIYTAYPNSEIGALFLNTDPIGSCVYNAEDMLASMYLYDGMFASLIMVDSLSVVTYYDSSFEGRAEIDAEFTYTEQGVSGSGYVRFIDGPDVGCYAVFYKVTDNTEEEVINACATAIETFEIFGDPIQTKYRVYNTSYELRIALTEGTFNDIVEDSGAYATYVDYGGDNAVMICEETNFSSIEDFMSSFMDDFSQMNITGSPQYYNSSRYQSMVVRGTFEYSGQTYQYGCGVIMLGNQKVYSCFYFTAATDVTLPDSILMDFLWSANVPT